MQDKTQDQPSFDEWLATGTTAQATVQLHNDLSVIDEMLLLDDRRAAIASAPERSLGDSDELAEIDDAYAALWDRWQAGTETWVIRALSTDEIKDIRRKHRAPKTPTPPSKHATPERRAAHEAEMLTWADAATKVREDADLDYLARAVVRVETASATFTGITVEQLAAVTSRAGRSADLGRLLAAAVQATTGEREPAAPFSQRESGTDQT